MRQELTRLSSSDLYGPIEGVIQRLVDIQKDYLKQGYTEIEAVMETEYGYYDDRWEVLIIYGVPPKPKKLTVAEILSSDKVQFHMD